MIGIQATAQGTLRPVVEGADDEDRRQGLKFKELRSLWTQLRRNGWLCKRRAPSNCTMMFNSPIEVDLWSEWPLPRELLQSHG